MFSFVWFHHNLLTLSKVHLKSEPNLCLFQHVLNNTKLVGTWISGWSPMMRMWNNKAFFMILLIPLFYIVFRQPGTKFQMHHYSTQLPDYVILDCVSVYIASVGVFSLARCNFMFEKKLWLQTFATMKFTFFKETSGQNGGIFNVLR